MKDEMIETWRSQLFPRQVSHDKCMDFKTFIVMQTVTHLGRYFAYNLFRSTPTYYYIFYVALLLEISM